MPYRITDDVEQAVAEVTGFYRVFHSMRTIRRTTILRLRREVDDSVIGALSDEPEILDLPRLALSFDLHGFGRLRMLIDRLNQLGWP